MAHRQAMAWVVLAGLVGPLGAAERPALVDQQERQRQIQADTDRLVRRLQTMIRVLEYNRLDRIAEKAMLDEVTGTLSGLSREQMTQLIGALEVARKSTGSAQERQMREAEVRHERIVLGLKAILARYDAVRSLEQAGVRLEKIARDQLAQYLQTSQILYEAENIPALKTSGSQPQLRIEHQAGEQGFVHRDLATLLQQLSTLSPLLPEEEKENLQRLGAGSQDHKLLDTLQTAQLHLRTQGAQVNRQTAWKRAVAIQWQASGDLQDLARQLRPAPDRLAALRQARQRIEQTIAEQEALHGDTGRPAEPRPDRIKDPLDDPALLRSRELSARQGTVAFLVRDARHMLQPLTEALAARVEPAEKDSRAAETAVRSQSDAVALRAQDRVSATLRTVLRELDGLIRAAEQAQADPLTALQDKLATVDQLVREQQDVRDKAQEANDTQQVQRLLPLTPKQQDLARRTDALAQLPTMTRPEVAQALEKANDAMERASEALQERKGAESVSRQDEALQALKEAKDSLAKQVEHIEQRRQEVGKLEDADRKLGEILKDQKKVAEAARQETKSDPEGKKADTDKLAQQQGKLTPPTRDVGKQVQKAAPEASQKVEAAARDMEQAKAQLDAKQAPAAADKADRAAKKLEEARKELARAIEQKKGEEAAEEQQAQPREVDTPNAAQQIAKALEQTQKAAQESQKASDALEPPHKTEQAARGLARVQKEIAQQAPRVKTPQAGKPAEKAAELLAKGEPQKALEEQKKALEQMEQAAQKEGPQGDRKEGGEQGDKKQADPAGNEKKDPSSGEKKEAGKSDPKKEGAAQDKKNDSGQQGEKKEGASSTDSKQNSGQGEKKESSPPADKKDAAPAGDKEENGQKGEKKDDGSQEKSDLPRPSQARTAAQLAQAQKKVMEATEAVARAQQAQRQAEQSRQESEPRASLAELQQQVADQARRMGALPAVPPASRAAEILKKGDISGAVPQQKQSLANLVETAQQQGQTSMRIDKTRPPLPLEAKNTAELAEAQRALIRADEAMAKSQAATQAAMSALGQAQAQAPQAVQDQLQQAGQQLARAGQQLRKGQAPSATQAQESAKEQLGRALQALTNALARAEEQAERQAQQASQKQGQEEQEADSQGQKSGEKSGQKPGQKPAQKPGQKPGRKPGKGLQLVPGQEKNETQSYGYRLADGYMRKSPSQLRDVRGEGQLIHLPPRQRELIRQALNDKLPPEYAALIQQYYINIAREKPPTGPTPPRR